MSVKRLLFVVNDPAFFCSHRLPLAEAAIRVGYEVWLASPRAPAVAKLVAEGIKYVEVPLVRASKNPIREIGSVAALQRVIARVRPDVMHLITMKPVLYGGVLARLHRVPLTVSAISGLGYTFIAQGTRAALLRQGLLAAFRASLGSPRMRVIFQNPDDRDLFVAHDLVGTEQVRMISGSGTDLSQFDSDAREPGGSPVILLPARMLWDKGVAEFVEAAKILRSRGHDLRFVLSGNTDDQNPASVAQAQLDAWNGEGLVEWLPHTQDIAGRLAACHLVVLPSYREGFPKTLIDAAASGRAVVTTNVPGCRDAIVSGKTGLLIPVKDSQALADAIETLVLDPDLRRAMGRAGRALAEERYSIDDVVAQHLAIYAEPLVRA